MATRKRHHATPRWEPGIVSVWVGAFPSRSAAAEYVSEDWVYNPRHTPAPFLTDFGIPPWFDLHAADGVALDRPTPIGRLARNEWFAGQPFAAAAVAECRRLGVRAANLVISLYGYRYPGEPGRAAGGMVFVGVFPCPTDAEPGAAADRGRMFAFWDV